MRRGDNIPSVSDYAHWNEDAQRVWYEENKYDMQYADEEMDGPENDRDYDYDEPDPEQREFATEAEAEAFTETLGCDWAMRKLIRNKKDSPWIVEWYAS